MTPKEAVQEYQYPGCMGGPFRDCYVADICNGLGCNKHSPGTRGSGIGRFFLGMPKGFCRLGACEKTIITIFEKFEDLKDNYWSYNKFNVPIWKYLDENSNTLVRGLCPRVNYPFIHIFLGNEIDNIDCLEITDKDIEGMD